MPSGKRMKWAASEHNYFTAAKVVDGLGLNKGQENDWTRHIAKAMKAPNELIMRQDLMSKMFEDKLDPDLRRELFARSMSLWKHGRVSKSVSVVTAGELKKAGPYIGPRGGKWADPKHTIPWKEEKPITKPTEKTLQQKLAYIGELIEAEYPEAFLESKEAPKLLRRLQDALAGRPGSDIDAAIAAAEAAQKKKPPTPKPTKKDTDLTTAELQEKARGILQEKILPMVQEFAPSVKELTLEAIRDPWVASTDPKVKMLFGEVSRLLKVTAALGSKSDVAIHGGHTIKTWNAQLKRATRELSNYVKSKKPKFEYPKKVELTDGKVAKLESGKGAKFGDYRIYDKGKFAGRAHWSAISEKSTVSGPGQTTPTLDNKERKLLNDILKNELAPWQYDDETIASLEEKGIIKYKRFKRKSDTAELTPKGQGRSPWRHLHPPSSEGRRWLAVLLR
jgi:hypothetical protein